MLAYHLRSEPRCLPRDSGPTCEHQLMQDPPGFSFRPSGTHIYTHTYTHVHVGAYMHTYLVHRLQSARANLDDEWRHHRLLHPAPPKSFAHSCRRNSTRLQHHGTLRGKERAKGNRVCRKLCFAAWLHKTGNSRAVSALSSQAGAFSLEPTA